MWAATDLGLFFFDGGQWANEWGGSPVGGVAVGPDGTVWFGGWSEEGEGVEWPWLARWDGGSWVGVDPNPVFRTAAGRTAPMAVSPDGVVWIFGGTPVPRLARFDGTIVEEVPIGDYPAGAVDVRVITAAPNGDLWLVGATGPDPDAGQIAARFDGETWAVYPWAYDDPDSGLATRMGPLRDLAAGADGVVWFAGDGGLVSYDGTEWTVHIEGQGIRNIEVAPDGTIWYSDGDGFGVHAFGVL